MSLRQAPSGAPGSRPTFGR